MNSYPSSSTSMMNSYPPSSSSCTMNSYPPSTGYVPPSTGGYPTGCTIPPSASSINISLGGAGGLGVNLGFGTPGVTIVENTYPVPGVYPGVHESVGVTYGTPGLVPPQGGYPAQTGYGAVSGYQTGLVPPQGGYPGQSGFHPGVVTTPHQIEEVLSDVRKAFQAQQIDSLRNAVAGRRIVAINAADCGTIVKTLWKLNQVEAARFLEPYCPDRHAFRASMEKNMWSSEYKIWSHL